MLGLQPSIGRILEKVVVEIFIYLQGDDKNRAKILFCLIQIKDKVFHDFSVFVLQADSA